MRRVGSKTLALISIAFALPLALTAIAQQGPEWASSLKWPDGKEVLWRATDAPQCDGSNVELRLNNASASSGSGHMKSATFSCARNGEYTSPERLFGSVPAGGAASAQAITCACAEKGGVRQLLSVDLEFLR